MTIAYSGDNITFPDLSVQNTAPSGFGFKNRIINGACVIDQRNAGASVTPTSFNYTVDRWYADVSVSSKFTVQQNAGAVTPPSGFTSYLGVTSTAATSMGAGDYYSIGQIIEGFNVADLDFGKSTARSITVSFWVRSSLTGNFGGVLRNGNGTLGYPFTYAISAANTWEQKTLTVAGPTTGTWLTTNGNGLGLSFSLGIGTTYSAAAGSWQSGNFLGATGAVSVVGTSGATFYITGVQLEKGSTATSFDYRPYGTELGLCQRYYWKIAQGSGEAYGIAGGGVNGNANWHTFGFPTIMRATPTVTVYGTWATSNCGQPTIRGASSSGFLLQTVATATAAIGVYPNSADDLIDASIEL